MSIACAWPTRCMADWGLIARLMIILTIEPELGHLKHLFLHKGPANVANHTSSTTSEEQRCMGEVAEEAAEHLAAKNLKHELGTPKHSADLPPRPQRMTHFANGATFQKRSTTPIATSLQHRKFILLHPTCIQPAWRGKAKAGGTADLLIFVLFSCFSLLGGIWLWACQPASAQHRQGHFTRAPAAEQIETHAAARMPICSHRRCKQRWPLF
jgi:hypothetical protein